MAAGAAKGWRFFPPVSAYDASARARRTVAADLVGMLLASSSAFPYGGDRSAASSTYRQIYRIDPSPPNQPMAPHAVLPPQCPWDWEREGFPTTAAAQAPRHRERRWHRRAVRAVRRWCSALLLPSKLMDPTVTVASIISIRTVAIGLIPKLTNLINDNLVKKYNSSNGVRDALVALQRDISELHRWMEKLEKIISPCEEMLDWSSRATELWYEVEHVIYAFLCEQDLFARECIARFRLAESIKELKKKLNKLADSYRSHKWDELPSSNMMDELGCRASSVLTQDQTDLIGCQKQLGDLITLLNRDSHMQMDNLKIISVVGCGGSGKSTLALSVCNSMKSLFDSYASVGVSGALDIKSLLMDIWRQVSDNGPLPETLEINHLIRKLNGFLATRRYLVLLDDVWKTRVWESLRTAFPNNKLGSRIILTTRIESVAISCSGRTELVVQMLPLDDDESRKLFLGCIFGTNECPWQFEGDMKRILNKCGGVPLVILRIASHLLGRGPMRIEAWEEISAALNCSWEFSNSEHLDSLNHVLSLSYSLLPGHLKDCVLFMSGFPAGAIIDVDVVISSWVAEEFVGPKSRGSIRQAAQGYLLELIGRHLIEPVQVSANGTVESVRMARVMHDILSKKAYEKGFYTKPPAIWSRLRTTRFNRLSLIGEDASFLADRSAILEQTRAVILHSCKAVPSLGKCKFLRVLVVHLCTKFSNEDMKMVARLIYLRVVVLNTPSVNELPCQIGNLQKLEVLVMVNSMVRKMPSCCSRFESLTCLKVGRVAFPAGIAKMQKLEKIEIFDVGASTREAVCELGELHSLKVLACCRNMQEDTDVTCLVNFMGSLRQLLTVGKLEELRLSGTNDCIQFLSFFPFDTSMCKLRKLCMDNDLYMIRIPTYVKSLNRLTDVSINIENFGAADLAILGNLPFLALLKLWIKRGGPVIIDFSETMFSLLHSLFISTNGLELKFNSGCLLMLQRLHVAISAGLELSGMHNVACLRALYVSICGGASVNLVDDIRSVANEAAAAHHGQPRVFVKVETGRGRTDPAFV